MRPHFSGAGIRMWAELNVSHFYKGNHWKRVLKLIFKGSGCFQFPEAVVTSTAKGSLRSTAHGSLQVLVVYRCSNCGKQL